MPLNTFDELRDNIGSTVRETQIETLIGTYVNLTLQEMHNYSTWTWLRRKTTFSTVASQEDYNLDEEIDRISLVRQTDTPLKLLYYPDHVFYKYVPNPEDLSTSTPRVYRLWEETGFSTNLAASDTVYVKSSSASDGSSFKAVVSGRNSSGERVTEVLTLNGTTNVTSSTTWLASGLISFSKSASTTGTISCYRTTGNTLLSEIAPSERAPRFKRLSLYPVPSSAITIYVEYYERFIPMVNDADVPQLDHKWIWVAREGALAKAFEYKQNEAAATRHQSMFYRGLDLMRREDSANYDYVPALERADVVRSIPRVIRVSDNGGYAVGYI